MRSDLLNRSTVLAGLILALLFGTLYAGTDPLQPTWAEGDPKDWSIEDEDLQLLQDIYRDIMKDTLEADGGYSVVHAAGDNVLQVEVEILAIMPNIRPGKRQTSAGQPYITLGSGEVGAKAEFRDSQTRELLMLLEGEKAVGQECKEHTDANTVANLESLFGNFAARLRRAMDRVHGRSEDEKIRYALPLGLVAGPTGRRCPAMEELRIKPKSECRWDCVSLGEIMLRLDPGQGRVATTRQFQAWEGGGEYNVSRGLKRCFGLDTAVVTAVVDNPVGRLLQDLIYQGGVDQSHLIWVKGDGVGRDVRNGLNFTERGFGVRAALGCSDRGHTAVSQLQPGQIDWERIFVEEGARWLHTGGIFAALSDSTPKVALEAMKAANKAGTLVSYDLNYRPSLWKSIGGQQKAQQVTRELAPYVDVMLGNEEDFTAALGFAVEGVDETLSKLDVVNFRRMIERVVKEYPNLRVVATTLRNAKTASINDWGAVCFTGGRLYEAAPRENLEIFDRVGGGDSFASGLIYGFLAGKAPQWAVDCGAAHGALAMTTPGDTTMATLAEVERVMKGGGARVAR